MHLDLGLDTYGYAYPGYSCTILFILFWTGCLDLLSDGLFICCMIVALEE